MRRKGEEIVGGGGKRGHGQRCMETVTTWRRNRLSRPHSWSHVDKLRVATGCWKAETHFFIAEVKFRPWKVAEAITQGSQRQAVRGPWSHPDSKPPICFPTASPHDCCPQTPEEYMADNEDSETVSKNTEVIYFFFHIFQKFSLSLIHRLFLVILPHLLFPTFCD